jgi:adenylate cyclase
MEIERKFLIKELPDRSRIKPVHYERYYLQKGKDMVVRIQKKGENYEYETKRTISDLEHEKEKHSITQEEFESLRKGKESEVIIRESYQIQCEPTISIKIYHERFEGLSRAEVEFLTKAEAENYTPQTGWEQK